MNKFTIGPVLCACVACAVSAGCAALPHGAKPVKITQVHTPSTPVSKIDLYYSGAVRAIEARDYAQALDYLQSARAIAPEDVRVINAFGVVYDKLGRFDLSRRYYAHAKDLDPTSRIVNNNLAYSERLQGLSDKPLAFASAAEAEAKLKPHDGLMPGSPVVVVPIAEGYAPVMQVATVPATEAAPELFKSTRRTQVAAVAPAARPAAAQAARVEVASANPAVLVVNGPKPIPVKATARLAGAPILLIDASGSPDTVKRVRTRLASLGWSVDVAPGAQATPVDVTRVDYPTRAPQVAQALGRTLRGSVPVRPCVGECTAIRLVIGKDARTWNLPKKSVTRS